MGITISIPNPLRNNDRQSVAVLALDMAVHSGIGAFAATVSTLNPMVGVTFGAMYFAGSHTVNALEQWLSERVGNSFGNQTTFTKMLKFAVAFLSGIALATVTCTFLGTPIVLSAGLNFIGAMFATTMTIATFVHKHAQVERVILGPSLLTALHC